MWSQKQKGVRGREGLGGWGHCITPVHVLSIKAAVARFTSLCLAALCTVRSDYALFELLTPTKEETGIWAFTYVIHVDLNHNLEIFLTLERGGILMKSFLSVKIQCVTEMSHNKMFITL